MFIPQVGVELVERFAFYERAKTAFAVVATGYVCFYLILYGVYGSLFAFAERVHSMETLF